MKRVVLLGTLLLALGGQAQPPLGAGGEGVFDFEDGQTVFATLGEEGKVSLDANPANVKAGRTSLRFDYAIAPNKFNALLKTGQPGEAAQIKSFRFWIKSDYSTNVIMVLQEQDSGRWTSLFHVPKNQWQRVELSLNDFHLAADANDPKDNNNKLDMGLVRAAALADFKQVFASLAVNTATKTVITAKTQAVGPNKTETTIEAREQSQTPTAKLLGLQNGPHTFWLDDFEAIKQPLPAAPEDPLGAIMIDDFVHPQLGWIAMGDMLIQRVSEEQMKQVGRAVSVSGQGLQAEYRQQAGEFVGFTKMLSPGLFKDMVALRFSIATEQAMTLLVQLEEIGGGKYNTTIELPADTKPGEVRLVPMLFEVAKDSNDNNKRLDLDQVKQILLIDATGLLGGAVADNALWISKLRIEQKPQ